MGRYPLSLFFRWAEYFAIVDGVDSESEERSTTRGKLTDPKAIESYLRTRYAR